MRTFLVTTLILSVLVAFAPQPGFTQEGVSWRLTGKAKHDVKVPDILDYQTLLCDPHMHTVFSDGMVWPTVRVDEAYREDLDFIAISDHIEYLPHKDDIPTNHNRAYDLTVGPAKLLNLLMPRGSEITRDTPPGHFNAIFLKDSSALDTDDFLTQIKIANQQGAFVFWNHQAWKGEERGSWRDIHTTIYDKKWLHGMEVANGGTYYPSAHQWCLDRGMTMLGSSDVHKPFLHTETTPDEHRTMTFVFVKERTLAGVKDALFAGRTAAWNKNQVIGLEKYLKEIFAQSITIGAPFLNENNAMYVELSNSSDIHFDLERTGDAGPESFQIPARSSIQIRRRAEGEPGKATLKYEVTNLLVAPGKGLPVELTLFDD